jgi:hypothetical protein
MLPFLLMGVAMLCSSSSAAGAAYFMFFKSDQSSGGAEGPYRKEVGVDYVESDDIFDMTGQGENACFNECDKQDRCVGVVFTADKNTCWGKQSLVNRTSNPDRITYIKN